MPEPRTERWPHIVRPLLRHAVGPNILPGILAFASGVLIVVAGAILGFAVNLNIYSIPIVMLGPATVFLTFAVASVYALYRDRPANPTAHIWQKTIHDWNAPARLLRGLPVLFLFPFFFGAFTSYKSALGWLVPFYFDPYAIAIDASLHGTDPWRLLHPLLGYGPITMVLNFFYNLWFLVMYAALAFVAFIVSDLRLRSQYLAAFVLCWGLIGILAATLLSSSGPCYYDYFFDNPHFNELLDYLRTTSIRYPIPAIETQQYLLTGFELNMPGMGLGITAAPSMHVSIAVLNALVLQHFGRLALVTGWTYACIILLGSIHLGWHYAIDGYIAAVLTVLIWRLSGAISNRAANHRFGAGNAWQATGPHN